MNLGWSAKKAAITLHGHGIYEHKVDASNGHHLNGRSVHGQSKSLLQVRTYPKHCKINICWKACWRSRILPVVKSNVVVAHDNVELSIVRNAEE